MPSADAPLRGRLRRRPVFPGLSVLSKPTPAHSKLLRSQAIHTTGTAYQKQLEQQLIELPAAIANGIRPETIAEKVNESLRQQFLSSGIPETAHALSVVSKQMNQVASDFHRTTRQLTSIGREVCSKKTGATKCIRGSADPRSTGSMAGRGGAITKF